MKTLQENGHVIEIEIFHQKLISWGKENFRSYPWRETQNPYFILLSEIMLHRTQAKQVQPVYERFIQKYQNLKTLRQATKNDLQELLFSLGLKWRTNLIYEMVQELIVRYDGKIPDEKEALLSLSGVSEYIAGAVRCFAWDFPEPLLDTNTVRVAGRLFGLEIKDSSRRNRRFKNLIIELLNKKNPRIYNYALLDLADKVCTKRIKPDCGNCPLLIMCKHGISISTKNDANPPVCYKQ